MISAVMGQRRLDATFRGTWVMLITAALCATFPPAGATLDDEVKEVSNWALSFGKSLEETSSRATYFNIIEDNFVNLGASVKKISARKMLDEILKDVQNVLSWKKIAVEKIADVAEYYAPLHQYDKSSKHDYYEAKLPKGDDEEDKELVKNSNKSVKSRRSEKTLINLGLKPHRNFAGAPVNFHESSVHVPTNVYDKEYSVINGIMWSEHLTNAFRNNLKVDPSLNWQYFGSSTGFLRIYPATTWITEGKKKPDFYDCRIRPWYIEAASSPKDVVILVDGSGSMTGIRKEIAKNVVHDILGTLTEDDFVTVMRFSDVTEPIVECFEDYLVPANDENKRMFMESITCMKTENIANFSVGLSTAFELLERNTLSEAGALCNQAIMLITDGAPNTFEEVFTRYNSPDIHVRVFTFLIGIEVTESHEVLWMACNNKGLFAHVASLPEVRDQVQRYVPVMSTPVILSGNRPFVWTSVYGDVPATELTYHEWKDREHEKIRHRLNAMRRRMWYSAQEDPDTETPDTTPEPKRGVREIRPLQLMTTVATPVFGKKNAKPTTLLGVAGVDVPIREIQKFTKPHKIGPNSYTFAITNNGYILFHPELRPLLQDLLKPSYRDVDLTKVELMDTNTTLYEYDDTLLTIRNDMIDRENSRMTMPIRIPMDNFRRVITRNNSYHYGPIAGTPFSLAISLPEPYGHYHVVGEVEVDAKTKEENLVQYFSGDNWKLHPEWVYCENPQEDDEETLSPENYIRLFLNELLPAQNFEWRNTNRTPTFDKTACEKDLIQSLLFDAKATLIDPWKKRSITENKAVGIITSFVATRSGLTRYEDYRAANDRYNSTEKSIYDTHIKATEEEFYKRAVDFHRFNSSAFVFSVPFDASEQMDTLVTGSRALFLTSGKKMAPAAVVGLQFNHSIFVDRFFATTSKEMRQLWTYFIQEQLSMKKDVTFKLLFAQMCAQCISGSCRKCDDEEIDCYLLDNNGFIVVSEEYDNTGKFFGEIDYDLFDSMVENGIYKRVHVYDYQAICMEDDLSHGFSPFLLTPFHHLRDIFNWFWSKIALFYIHLNLYEWWSSEWVVSATDYEHEEEEDDGHGPISRTIPEPCEKEVDLYEMLPLNFGEPLKKTVPSCSYSGCKKEFIVQPVPYTNLVMLVVSNCPCPTTSVSLKAQEIKQNETERCIRMRESLYRRRPDGCFNILVGDSDMDHECGGCSCLRAVTILNLLAIFTMTHVLTQRFLLV